MRKYLAETRDRLRFVIRLTLGLAFLCGCGPHQSDEQDWPLYGNDSQEERFSPLRQISADNVGRLGLEWSLDLPDEHGVLEATPVEVGGVIYFSGVYARVYAVDARTGRLLWQFDPRANEADPRAVRKWPANRGVAYSDGRIFVATRNCQMIALDAATGSVLWSTSFLVPGSPATSTGAPRVFKNRVIIGNSGAELGARGYVTAFDARTGRIAWRFFTVPGDPAKGFENPAMAMAAKTWSGEWWKYGGGGTAWNAITFDEELNRVYIGVGNAGPWNGLFRNSSGEDNLFVSSVVALDADTGNYVWHHQYNPGEVWDYKATADIVLADLKIDKKNRKVLMQAPSDGFLYVIDRQTGKLISAEKIGKVTWASHVDLKTGRPVEVPGARYEKKAFVMYPGGLGAHNYQAMSYSPGTGLVYIPYIQQGMIWGPRPAVAAADDVTTDPGELRMRIGVPASLYTDPTDPMDNRSSLLAWDPVTQQLRWRVDYPTLLNSGTMVTAGNLVFQGTATGQFLAYAADTGAQLWQFDAKHGISAPPITYSVGGRQFVSILVGYGGMGDNPPIGWKYGAQPRRLLTFSLDGKAKLPTTALRDSTVAALDDPAIRLDPSTVAKGEKLFNRAMCPICHGGAAISFGIAPDLRESGIAFDRQAFGTLLVDGSRVSQGMPKFDELNDNDIDALYQYIRARARARSGGQAETMSSP